MADRLKWVDTSGHFGYLYRSACGRYAVAWHSTQSGYYALRDFSGRRHPRRVGAPGPLQTWEYVCLSVASAKELARDLERLTPDHPAGG